MSLPRTRVHSHFPMRPSALIRIAALTLLASLCVAHVWGQVAKYLSRDTTDVSKIERKPHLDWPAIVLCPHIAFNLTSMSSMGLSDSFWDVFFEDSAKSFPLPAQLRVNASRDKWKQVWFRSIHNMSKVITKVEMMSDNEPRLNLSYKSISAPAYGDCLMLEIPIRAASITDMIEIRTGNMSAVESIEMLFFERGLEMSGFPFDYWPAPPSAVTLQKGKVISVGISRFDTALENSLEDSCDPGSYSALGACLQAEAAAFMKLKSDDLCFVPAFSPFTDALSLCNSTANLLQSMFNLVYSVPFAMARSSCNMPCHSVSYSLTKRGLGLRQSNGTRDSAIAWVNFDTLNVRTVSEYMLFDSIEILSAIGGSLGLFLGYSVKSITDFIVDKVEKKEKAQGHVKATRK